MTEAEMLRACHLSGQMSAEQSVSHFAASELPAASGKELPVTMHERPSMLANRWFWLAAVVSGLLWGLAGIFIK